MIFTQIGTPFFLWGGSSGTHCIHFYFNTRRLHYLNRGEIENSQSLARRSCDFVQLTVKFLQGNSAGVVNTYINSSLIQRNYFVTGLKNTKYYFYFTISI
jgi:hypothetical protein